jgi:hypothetical protein
MSVKALLAFVLALILCGSLHASNVGLDDSCTGTPLVGPTFTFLVPAPVSGTSSECQQASVQFRTLDLFFDAPPAAVDITSCTSNLFAVCTVSQSGGITDVHFAAGSLQGVAAGMDFNIKLEGFTTGQQINGAANAPEPGVLGLVAFGILAAIFSLTIRECFRRSSFR